MGTTPLRIATDGGCRPNPGPGGWAWVAEDGTYGAGAFAQGTNNIGELLALRHTLLDHPDIPIHIVYDSQYAVNCVTVWGPSWIQKGILFTKKNHVLILEIIEILQRRPATAPVTWEWVKGHKGHPLNERADHHASRMTKLRREHIEHDTEEPV